MPAPPLPAAATSSSALEISRSQSWMERRCTSVGCAVSTGTTAISPSQRRTSAALTPAADSLASAAAAVPAGGTAPGSRRASAPATLA